MARIVACMDLIHSVLEEQLLTNDGTAIKTEPLRAPLSVTVTMVTSDLKGISANQVNKTMLDPIHIIMELSVKIIRTLAFYNVFLYKKLCGFRMSAVMRIQMMRR